MTANITTPNLYKDAVRRISQVVHWHSAAPPRHGRRLCTECGQPWPCRTREMLLGRKEAGDGR